MHASYASTSARVPATSKRWTIDDGAPDRYPARRYTRTRSRLDLKERGVPIIVQKYGGTSVGSVERIQVVADRVVAAREAGNDVVVVVSAMGDTTDELMQMAHLIAPMPDPRELDMLLTAGERIAMSLLGIAINARGCKAASYTGSQAGIMTDTQHGSAKIVEIRPKRIIEALGSGVVVVLAGFQGLSMTQYEITTLGRGGSDLTAVAMAGAIGADVCEIYTDVAGVFTADPRIEPKARKVDVISYDEMLELAAAGAKVLQSRSVEYARRYGVRLHVRSSFDDAPGTWVQEVDDMEGVLISGVALDADEAKITLGGVPDRPGVAAAVFRAIADDGISIDMIVQNVSHAGATDLSFTAPRVDVPRVRAVMERVVSEIGAEGFTVDDDIAKVSLVGAGMKTHPGVAADMFDALAEEGINIEMISTSPIRISCVVRRGDGERALDLVHHRFELDLDRIDG
jgi:aspartate kinase